MYTIFPEAWWDKKEPPPIREPNPTIRKARLTKRLLPTFRDPKIHVRWLKAIHVPTSTIVGIAGWFAPGSPVHNPWRRSAVDYYGWKALMGWSDAEVDEMWTGVSLEAWDGEIGKGDEDRKRILGEEKHWYLAPLLTWPEWQGKGVASKLMKWAIERADRETPVTPLYLESAPTARAVYLHHGFQPEGEAIMLRRGPGVVKGSNESKGGLLENVSVEVVEQETERDLAA